LGFKFICNHYNHYFVKIAELFSPFKARTNGKKKKRSLVVCIRHMANLSQDKIMNFTTDACSKVTPQPIPMAFAPPPLFDYIFVVYFVLKKTCLIADNQTPTTPMPSMEKIGCQ
jgi:hypothetical protein